MKFKFFYNKIANIFKPKKEENHFSIESYVKDIEDDDEYDDSFYSNSASSKYNIDHYYNIIICNLSNKFKKGSNLSFSNYINKKFKNKNQILVNKIEKYLNRYFKYKRLFAYLFNRYPFDINSNYRTLNYNVSRIEKIYGPIFSYDVFMKFGNNVYNLSKMKKDNKQITEVKKETKKKETKKIELKKKEIVTTPKLEELKTNKRKLLYKIRKMDKILKETRDQLSEYKENSMNTKLLRDKEALLQIENMMYDERLNNDVFNEQRENSRNIRRENAIKSLETFLRRKKNKTIEESLEDYFGEDQLSYFSSLGIDLSLYNINLKK